MEDQTATDIINEWQREDEDASNTMSLYQSVADHFMQRENSITNQKTPGEDKSLPVIDPTGRISYNKMCAGISAVMFPPGKYFCRLTPDESAADNNDAISYLNRLTRLLHTQLFKPSCNFILEINENIQSWVGFGTANIQSMWDKENLRLKFKDWDVANFRFGVDADGFPNRCWIRWQYTAQQAFEKWGDDAGTKVVECMNSKDKKKTQEKFWFIWRVQPRKNRNPLLKDSIYGYAFEEIVVNETEKATVKEDGYKQFPHHISRWLTTSQEKYGYGQGVFGLSADKDLQTQHKDLKTCAGKHNFPPMETLHSFEGTPKLYPGANNRVMELGSVQPIANGNLNGNFPVTKDTLEMTRQILRDIFFEKVFAPLDNLTGDRRNEMEIAERINSGYRQMVLPVTRYYNECLTPLVERCVLLLLENYMIEAPPPELRGFKVEYLGRLALALQEQESDALQRYAQFSLGMEQVVPNFTVDTINVDRAGRRMATTFGVNEGDLNTDEEKAAIREERKQRQQAQEQLQAAMAMGSAYKDGSKAAEAGSPAEALMAGVG